MLLQEHSLFNTIVYRKTSFTVERETAAFGIPVQSDFHLFLKECANLSCQCEHPNLELSTLRQHFCPFLVTDISMRMQVHSPSHTDPPKYHQGCLVVYKSD